MVKTKKVKENIECWFCHRKAKDVMNLGTKLGLGMFACEEKEALNVAMGFYTFLDMKEPIPICYICWLTMTELGLQSILSALNIENEEDIITKADLEDIKFKIVKEKNE